MPWSISISLYRFAYPDDLHIRTYHLVTSMFGYAMIECIGSYYWYVIYEGIRYFILDVAKGTFISLLHSKWYLFRRLTSCLKISSYFMFISFFILFTSTGGRVLVFLFHLSRIGRLNFFRRLFVICLYRQHRCSCFNYSGTLLPCKIIHGVRSTSCLWIFLPFSPVSNIVFVFTLSSISSRILVFRSSWVTRLDISYWYVSCFVKGYHYWCSLW